MATERLSMRRTRKILRQRWVLGRTQRDIGTSTGVSASMGLIRFFRQLKKGGYDGQDVEGAEAAA
jgi:hypothetical protein